MRSLSSSDQATYPMSMDGHRQKNRPSRKRTRRERAESKGRPEPVLIAARRPDAPVVRPQRSFIAASAAPKRTQAELGAAEPRTSAKCADNADIKEKRSARIVKVSVAGTDEREEQRNRLLLRLLASDGRVAISRAANDYVAAGFTFPSTQDVQLQLLEHFDEVCAREALEILEALLRTERPIKRPVFEQRLRRLEEFGDDPRIREAAASLRRAVRAESRWEGY
jgi:hypothetical protein